MPFHFQPYCANAKQLRQAEVILDVSTQLGWARTSLRGILHDSTNPLIIINITIIWRVFPLSQQYLLVAGCVLSLCQAIIWAWDKEMLWYY